MTDLTDLRNLDEEILGRSRLNRWRADRRSRLALALPLLAFGAFVLMFGLGTTLLGHSGAVELVAGALVCAAAVVVTAVPRR